MAGLRLSLLGHPNGGFAVQLLMAGLLVTPKPLHSFDVGMPSNPVGAFGGRRRGGEAVFLCLDVCHVNATALGGFGFVRQFPKGFFVEGSAIDGLNGLQTLYLTANITRKNIVANYMLVVSCMHRYFHTENNMSLPHECEHTYVNRDSGWRLLYALVKVRDRFVDVCATTCKVPL